MKVTEHLHKGLDSKLGAPQMCGMIDFHCRDCDGNRWVKESAWEKALPDECHSYVLICR